MKIRDIYMSKKLPVISIAIALLCIIITLISQLVSSTYMAFTFTYPVKYPWQLLTYVFLQGIPAELVPADLPYSSMEITIGHLGYNLMLILPFGIFVEKVIGSKWFLAQFTAVWIINVIVNFIMGMIFTKGGDSFAVSGASGIAFSFMPAGIFIIFVMGKKYGFGKLFRQVSFTFPFQHEVYLASVATWCSSPPAIVATDGVLSFFCLRIAEKYVAKI